MYVFVWLAIRLVLSPFKLDERLAQWRARRAERRKQQTELDDTGA
jgi:hypothetical protein